MGLIIKDLCVSIEQKEILKNFSLNIGEGEIHVIMGPNGMGKSTLSKVIMGDNTYKVLDGRIIFNDIDITNMPTDERAKLGIFMAMQNPISIDGLSNSEFLKTALTSVTNKHVGLYDFIKQMEKGISDLGMSEDMLHRSINQGFSGGERKKNEILQMKILKPKLIILDELDSGLDVDSLKIVCENINDYLKQNKDTSILMITHYPRILEYLKPHYVHALMDGHIVKTGDYSLANLIEKNGYLGLNDVSES